MCRSDRFYRSLLSLLIFSVSSLLISIQTAAAEDFNFPGLSDTVTVYEDQYGVPTIVGKSELDVAFVQGYIHARDRFFQLDYSRKIAQGRLAELVGSPALPTDVQLRTLGIGRAALASLQAADAEAKGMLQAYANGVNAWLNSNPLPPEYAGLEITRVDPWQPLDSAAFFKLVAFQLSFGLDIDATIDFLTYQGVGAVVGFDGAALYFEDINRSQPADGRVTVPGFLSSIGGIGQAADSKLESQSRQQSISAPTGLPPHFTDATLAMAKEVKEKFSQSPILAELLKPREKDKGSNEWAVSGEFTDSGYPLIANDPHLALDTPSTFHEVNLVYDLGEDSYSVSGIQFPGAAGVIQGCNDSICWGSTVHHMDVTDVFQDQIIANAFGLPSETVHTDGTEPLTFVFQSYFVNIVGDGTPDNIVPTGGDYLGGSMSIISQRRNNGPFLAFLGDAALFVQYTGWSATQDTRFVLDMNRASNMDEFKAALQYFDAGSQNWIYSDVEGNIGYFTSAEMPIRADLAAGTVGGGVPPWFIRDGTGALNHECGGTSPTRTTIPSAPPWTIIP
jgi:penicillin amidase